MKSDLGGIVTPFAWINASDRRISSYWWYKPDIRPFEHVPGENAAWFVRELYHEHCRSIQDAYWRFFEDMNRCVGCGEYAVFYPSIIEHLGPDEDDDCRTFMKLTRRYSQASMPEAVALGYDPSTVEEAFITAREFFEDHTLPYFFDDPRERGRALGLASIRSRQETPGH
ncbi:hypothetical protein [Flaviflexus equikiangi]|uniref:hypothetical protein n=1 Tax=Flaviflexus equikiangi TaxID=2758573 RepID=UPI0015F42C10|nr:hypothetical protein [Flaviflexus equikiangi]